MHQILLLQAEEKKAMVEIQLEVGADLLALATVLVLGQPAPVSPNNLGTQCLTPGWEDVD